MTKIFFLTKIETPVTNAGGTCGSGTSNETDDSSNEDSRFSS